MFYQSPATSAFGLGCRKDDVVDILDHSDRDRSAQDGLETARFGLDRLPHVPIETALGDVQKMRMPAPGSMSAPLGVEHRSIDFVALPKPAAFALLV
jgi:hypothetical protein